MNCFVKGGHLEIIKDPPKVEIDGGRRASSDPGQPEVRERPPDGTEVARGNREVGGGESQR